jgi:protein-S-isoprenylcysteine O-methyltransferase Ste14
MKSLAAFFILGVKRYLMTGNYLILALLWILYCIVHSVLISIRLSRYFNRVLGSAYRFYRLLFNVFSAITLVPLALYSRSARFRTPPFLLWSGYGRIPQCCLMALAAALIVGGARHYNISRFLGIRQIREGKTSAALTGGVHFERSGILGVIRHPWYAAVLIFLWSMNLNAAEIVISIILSIYLVIGAALEERKLTLEFGSKYRRYKDDVSMFIPLKWLMAKRPR